MLLVLIGAVLVVASGTATHADETFIRGTLDFSTTNPTSLAIGPDGRLYVASQTSISALTLDPSGTEVVATETVATGQVGIHGIAFDPTAPASPVVIYASRRHPPATDSYEGVVSTYTGPTWTRSDVITGLPNSTPFSNHFTNGLAFDPSGVLYIAQGSNTDAGLAGPNWPETPLSAAILVADVGAPGFDGAVTYDPSTPPTDDNVDQTGGDVEVFAPGTRNPYDLLVHSNGSIYATDNGASGPNTSTSCTTSGTGVAQNDELNLIEDDEYYGFPNRNRGRLDERQCTYHAPQEGDGPDFTAPIEILPAHCSCDGIVEFTSGVYGPTWQGDLIMAQFVLGRVARVNLTSDGLTVLSVTTIDDDFSNPLDVTIGPTGIIYVAELGSGEVSYLVPQSKAVGGLTELVSAPADTSGYSGLLIFAVGASTVLGLLLAGLAWPLVRIFRARTG